MVSKGSTSGGSVGCSKVEPAGFRRLWHGVWATLLLGLVGVPAGAAEEEFARLRLETPRVTAGDPAEIVIETTGSDWEVVRLELPEGVIPNPAGRESRVEMSGSGVRHLERRRFAIHIPEPGVYTLGPAVLQRRGQSYRTQTVQLRVESPGNEGRFELRVALDPPRVWEGQPFRQQLDIELGSAVQLHRWLLPGDEPFETLGDPLERVGSPEGPAWVLARWLVPREAGEVRVHGGRVVALRQDRRSGRRTQLEQAVPTRRIEVDPLPEPPAGLNFLGAVGELQLSWERVSTQPDRIEGVLTLEGLAAATGLRADSFVEQGWLLLPGRSDVSIQRGPEGAPHLRVRIPVTLVPATAEPQLRPAWFDSAEGRYRPLAIPESLPAPKSVSPGVGPPIFPPATAAPAAGIRHPQPGSGLVSGWLTRKRVAAMAWASLCLALAGALLSLRPPPRPWRRVLRRAMRHNRREDWLRLYDLLDPDADPTGAGTLRAGLAQVLFRPAGDSEAREVVRTWRRARRLRGPIGRGGAAMLAGLGLLALLSGFGMPGSASVRAAETTSAEVLRIADPAVDTACWSAGLLQWPWAEAPERWLEMARPAPPLALLRAAAPATLLAFAAGLLALSAGWQRRRRAWLWLAAAALATTVAVAPAALADLRWQVLHEPASLRAGPEAAAVVLDELAAGTLLSVRTAARNGWRQVHTGSGLEGWLPADALRTLPATEGCRFDAEGVAHLR